MIDKTLALHVRAVAGAPGTFYDRATLMRHAGRLAQEHGDARLISWHLAAHDRIPGVQLVATILPRGCGQTVEVTQQL